MVPDHSSKEIVYKAFSYSWCNRAFLSEPQVRYALKRLWLLTSGTADWTGGVTIRFRAVSRATIDEMLDADPGTIAYVSISDLTPDGFDHELDSDSMPSLCMSYDCERAIYIGSGFYPFDLIALTFILLTRWEEWARPVLDQFQRYQETASLAVRQGFHQRPLLDEWALILRPWLYLQSPAWLPVLPDPSISISHDIDHLCYYKSWTRVFRGFLRGLVHQHSLFSACRNAHSGLVARLNHFRDPCVTAIDDLILFDESLELKGTFFLMATNSTKFDDGYDIKSPILRKKIDRFLENGHQIAWHPGFYAPYDNELYRLEYDRFREICSDRVFGVRHHYLRWQASESWRQMELLGISYDASLGYSNTCGFRCSTAHTYPAYDLIKDREIKLEVRPFVLMDGYLLKDLANAKLIIKTMLSRCWKVNGCFSLVMHNYTIMISPDFLDVITMP